MRGLSASLGALVLVLGGLGAQDRAERLEGIVLDPLSRPVANAAVQVEADGLTIARTQTDAEGVFVLGRLPARGLVVRATTTAPDVGAVEVDLAAEPHAFVHIRLMPARAVSGTVHAAGGAPIAGAWVVFAPTGSRQLTPVGDHCRSDAEGRFALPAVPYSCNVLRVWADGFAGTPADVDGTGPQQLDVVLSRDDVPETSFALAHAPAAQCATAVLTVVAHCQDVDLRLPPALRTPPLAPDGRFWLRGWPEGDTLLAHLHVPDASIEPPLLAVEAGSSRRERQFFVEDPSDVVFRGRLVGEHGASTAGVHLQLQACDQKALQLDVTTGPDGSFELRSPVGLGRYLELRTQDPGLALHPAQERDGPGEPLADRVWCHQRRNYVHEFVLRPAVTLRAALLDASGQPWRGATVALLRGKREQATHHVGRAPPFCAAIAAVLATSRSDARGTAVLSHLALDAGAELVLQVSGPGGYLEHAFVTTGGAQDLGTLRAGPAAGLRAHTMLANGTATPGARMVLESYSGCARTIVVTADRDGRFDLTSLPPGPCLVSFLGYNLPQDLVTLVAGETQEVQVRLQ